MGTMSSFELDLDSVEQGRWVKHKSGVWLCIASISRQAYSRAAELLLRPHAAEIRNDTLSVDEIVQIVPPAAAEHLLVDWRDLFEEDGKTPIPYSPAKALAYFRNPKYKPFYDFVRKEAGATENYHKDFVKESLGNLPPSSGGSSPGDPTKNS